MKSVTGTLAQCLATVVVCAVLLIPAGAQKKAAEKFPVTYACKHCKIKMTVKDKKELKKTCWVCKCKKTAEACRPDAKK